MKYLYLPLIALFLFSCSVDGDEALSSEPSDSSIDESGSGNSGASAGLVTAGEWSDLNNWDFWLELLENPEFAGMPAEWGYYTHNRLSVRVRNNAQAAANLPVVLKLENETIWAAKTDIYGKAELWISLHSPQHISDLSAYSLWVNGTRADVELSFSEINAVELSTQVSDANQVQIAFMVDATASMSDELEFLKADLKDVITRVENQNQCINISTGSVFYRDEGDDYVVRESPFQSDLETTINFIDRQSANGGGDYPEAVHTALDATINNLQWSPTAESRIAFMLLDAPPHQEQEVISSIHASVATAAQNGIKLIPIVASGIDKPTEFLMRFISITTNGTYVFITNDSGIGLDHLEPSVGQFEVEFLNDLMVRIIEEHVGCARF